jgi:hypothetical protein
MWLVTRIFQYIIVLVVGVDCQGGGGGGGGGAVYGLGKKKYIVRIAKCCKFS